MKTPDNTTRDGQPKPTGRRLGRAVAHGAWILGIFLVSLAATFTVTHIMINRFADHHVTVLEMVQSSVFGLVVALACLATMAAGSLLLLIGRHEGDDEPSGLWPPETLEPPEELESEPEVRPSYRQVLRLTRNAERLDHVEQDLIRTIALSEQVNPRTRRLLTEMRVCTCRLLGELSDIDRLRKQPEETTHRWKKISDKDRG